jgi:hypothetical protein
MTPLWAKFVLQHRPEISACSDGQSALRAGFGCTSMIVQGELNE